MSAPLLWIGIPAAASIVLFGLRKRTTHVLIAGGLISLFMAWMAWQFPIDVPVSIGPISIKITQSMSLFGRGFSIVQAQQPFLAFLFLSAACWYVGGLLADPGDYFGPATMAILSLLIAALAVEPFLYAALLIELAVLISIPLLAPAWKLAGRGVFRFLTFQTFGMPFILFTGWMLTGIGTSAASTGLVVTASILLGLGFAFLLGIFPFHSWMPMLAEQSHPYASGLLFFFFPGIISVFALGFFDRYVWLREAPTVMLMLQWVGVIMVLFAGLWAAFQSHLGKIFGFAAMVETGLMLLSIGLGTPGGLGLYFSMWVIRLVAFIIWTIALSRLARLFDGDLSFKQLSGSAFTTPYISFALLIAHLSLVGAPALAAFPLRLALWQAVSGLSTTRSLLLLAGAGGMLVSAMRSIQMMFSIPDNLERSSLQVTELQLSPFGGESNLPNIMFFLLSLVVLVLIGWFPEWVHSAVSNFPLMFQQLGS